MRDYFHYYMTLVQLKRVCHQETVKIDSYKLSGLDNLYSTWVGCNTKLFEFWVFLLQDWFPYQDQKAQSALLFSHSWKENSRIHTFIKTLCEMQTALSRSWTLVSVFISYDGNHFTINAFLKLCIHLIKFMVIISRRYCNHFYWRIPCVSICFRNRKKLPLNI